MIATLLAHGSGGSSFDKVVMLFGFPTVVAVGLYVATRQKREPANSDTADAESSLS